MFDKHIEFFDLFKSKTSYFIIGGISLVVAMQWNSFMKEIVADYIPQPNKNFANFLYSIIITIILVIFILMLPAETPESSRPNNEITALQLKRLQRDNIALQQRLTELEVKQKSPLLY